MTGWMLGSAILLSAVVAAEAAADWRLELLKENGLSTETEELEKFQNRMRLDEAGLAEKVRTLGSEEFNEREQAQKEILQLGKKVLPKLRTLVQSDEAEVRIRIAAIIKILEAGGRWERDDLLRQAVTSLLDERKNPAAARPDPRLFVEFFSKEAPSLADGYQRLKCESGVGATGSVRDGVARLDGQRDDDGDQRLLFLAKDLTGRAELPGSFRIEVKIGGEEEGSGGYHVGVSVGDVRVLFHPGYRTGGFRFEQVSNNKPIVMNTNMGFDPPAGKLLRMGIGVKRQRDGDVEIGVTVTSDKDFFKTTQRIKGDIIGKLDRIGLDRSGRGGGDALFDDLIVELE